MILQLPSAAYVLLLAKLVSNYFILRYPPSVAFDDDLEGSAPCGSFAIDLRKDSVTDFHTGGDTVFSAQSAHPATSWLFRAILN